ncbi:hypothetical protein C6502_15375 [Candidatus Poribacteria bacterium]|nr:MAG: hypothetical protein C6502_15375 [Candidatus Poribacteria bacterium]
MQERKQTTKDLPRVRISSRLSKTWIQRQENRRQAVRHLPAFNARHIARRTMRRRRRRAALTIALIVHLIAGFFVIQSIREHIVEDDVIHVEWVELPPPARTLVKPRPIEEAAKAPNDARSSPTQAKVIVPVLSATNTQEPPPLEAEALPNFKVGEIETQQRGDTATLLPDSPTERRLDRGSYTRSGGGKGSSGSIGGGTLGGTYGEGRGGTSSGSGLALAPDEALGLSDEKLVPEDRLGAILEGEGMDIRGHIRLIRLKHSLSDWWQDPSAIPSFAKWLEDNTQLRVDMNYAGGSLHLTDPRILSAPMVIMTGHDKDMTVGRNLATPDRKKAPLAPHFTSEERAALRKYVVERGGMLFYDDCGFNGLLAATVAHEIYRIFPEYPLQNLMHTHKIYSIYYDLPLPPTGGDVFWKSENHPKPSKFKYQKGVTINNRLGVVYNRKDYLCAMETVEISSRTMLRMRRSKDVHRFMTNLLIYTMKYGGNTDRSGYKP